MIQTAVDREPVQPGGQRRFPPEAVELAIGLQEDVLQQLFRIGRVAREPVGERVDPLRVGAIERLEGRLLRVRVGGGLLRTRLGGQRQATSTTRVSIIDGLDGAGAVRVASRFAVPWRVRSPPGRGRAPTFETRQETADAGAYPPQQALDVAGFYRRRAASRSACSNADAIRSTSCRAAPRPRATARHCATASATSVRDSHSRRSGPADSAPAVSSARSSDAVGSWAAIDVESTRGRMSAGTGLRS